MGQGGEKDSTGTEFKSHIGFERQDDKHITLPSSMTTGPKSPAKSTRSRVGVTSHRCTVAQVTKHPKGGRDSGMTFWAGFHMKHQGFYVVTK